MAEFDNYTGSRQAGAGVEDDSKGRKKYSKPVLTCYGDVRDITLGPSPGFGESGCAFDRRPGAGGGCP